MEDYIAKPLDTTRLLAAHVVVFFNATNTAVTFTNASLEAMSLQLDPLETASSDETLQQAKFNKREGTATIPALTTAVFVAYQE
jgi:pullulanase